MCFKNNRVSLWGDVCEGQRSDKRVVFGLDLQNSIDVSKIVFIRQGPDDVPPYWKTLNNITT